MKHLYKVFKAKGFRRWIFFFSVLKLFSPLLLFFSIIPVLSEEWLPRLLLIGLSFLGLTFGSMSFYLALLGLIFYSRKKDPNLKIYIWAFLFHLLLLFLLFFLGKNTAADRTLMTSCLDFSLGGPWLWNLAKDSFNHFCHLLSDPSYFIPFVQ